MSATAPPVTPIARLALPVGSPSPAAMDFTGTNIAVVATMTDKYVKQPALIKLADGSYWLAYRAKFNKTTKQPVVDLVPKSGAPAQSAAKRE